MNWQFARSQLRRVNSGTNQTCCLHHTVSEERLQLGYLSRLNYRLAQAIPSIVLITHTGSMAVWHRQMIKNTGESILRVIGAKRDNIFYQMVVGMPTGWGCAEGLASSVAYLCLLIAGREALELRGLATPEAVSSTNPPAVVKDH